MSNIKITHKTIKNTKYSDKPNEDYYIYNENIFIILDGVSRDLENGIYPNPSPAKVASKTLGDSIFSYINNNMKDYKDIYKLINDSIVYSNKKIADYNLKLNHPFKAGAVGIVMIIKDNIAYYEFIGDCLGITISENTKEFTRCQTELISLHSKEFSASEIRNNICNNIKHPYAYGVLNGDPNAILFLEKGQLNITSNTTIILSSDGLYDYIKNNLNNIKEKTADEILSLAVLDNNINQDDRSIIKIDFK